MMTSISRLYETREQAYEAIRALKTLGVRDTDISLVSRDANGATTRSDATTATSDADGAATGAGVGGALGAGAGLLAGLGVIAILGLGPVVAAGWLAAALTGAAAGAATGGVIGALTDAGVDERDANVYAESVRRGGSLVVVRVNDEDARQVETVLDRYQPQHLADRRSLYEREGWKTFDPRI